MRRLVFLITLVLFAAFMGKVETTEHYYPNPFMEIEITTKTGHEIINGTFTHVYLKGNRVSIVEEDGTVKEFPMEEVTIRFNEE